MRWGGGKRSGAVAMTYINALVDPGPGAARTDPPKKDPKWPVCPPPKKKSVDLREFLQLWMIFYYRNEYCRKSNGVAKYSIFCVFFFG